MTAGRAPRAPMLCIVATAPPANTPPPFAMAEADIAEAAHDPATIPLEEKPTACTVAMVATGVAYAPTTAQPALAAMATPWPAPAVALLPAHEMLEGVALLSSTQLIIGAVLGSTSPWSSWRDAGLAWSSWRTINTISRNQISKARKNSNCFRILMDQSL